MYSDTHFHFKLLCGGDSDFGGGLLAQMNGSDPLFAMDIGTKASDLEERVRFASECLEKMPEEERKKAERRLYFSAGIWPDPDEIRRRDECVGMLRGQIERFLHDEARGGRLAAVGECGLDHHWNAAGPDARDGSDFTRELLDGERELFMMQLDLARKLDLPVVVHSRDAFEETLECLDGAAWHRGIIHCFSYGIDEARSFLDRGWYIALGGAVTYTKKSRMEEMHRLLNFIPGDRILLETDAPYLSPVPLRGQKNTPLNIRHTCAFIASHRGVSEEELSGAVDENIRRLFSPLFNQE